MRHRVVGSTCSCAFERRTTRSRQLCCCCCCCCGRILSYMQPHLAGCAGVLPLVSSCAAWCGVVAHLLGGYAPPLLPICCVPYIFLRSSHFFFLRPLASSTYRTSTSVCCTGTLLLIIGRTKPSFLKSILAAAGDRATLCSGRINISSRTCYRKWKLAERSVNSKVSSIACF